MSRAQFTRAELKAGVTDMLAGRMKKFGALEMTDAMAAFALIAHDGTVTADEVAQLVAALRKYEDQSGFSGLMTGLVEELKAKGSPAPPAPAPSRPDIDSRIVGRWSYTSYYSAGQFSSTFNRVLILADNGRFAEDGSANLTLRNVDDAGRWVGTTSAYSDGEPGERGRWTAKNGALRLDYDDSSYAQYTYEVGGPLGERRLLTRSQRGKEQFWVEF